LSPELWNGIAAEALAVVRKTNPNRSVLIGPGMWNSVTAITDLKLPADSFLIATVHYYKPDVFTHQSASWVKGSDAWLGTKWRASESERKLIISHFDKVDSWAAQAGVPIFLGEFGDYDAGDTISSIWIEQ
jgi:endoglucanase